MENYIKFLDKLPKKLREKLIKVVLKIAARDLKRLDIKPLTGFPDFYRCRIGKIRIVFQKSEPENIIHDIGYCV